MEKLPQTIDQFNKLLSLEKIEHRHLEPLSDDEKAAFMGHLYKRLSKLDGGMRNDLVEKTIGILDKEFIWEHNHTKITEAIKWNVIEHGTVPNNSHLAAECGLSRKTVREHLKSFDTSETCTDKKEGINIMRQNIIGTVMKAALKGDLKAAKLYLETTDPSKGSQPIVNNQNNYIQINKTVINQQVIQQLKPEQLQLIEQIIAGNNSKSE